MNRYWNTFGLHEKKQSEGLFSKYDGKSYMIIRTLRDVFDSVLINRFKTNKTCFSHVKYFVSLKLCESGKVIRALWLLCVCIVVSAPGGDAVWSGIIPYWLNIWRG